MGRPKALLLFDDVPDARCRHAASSLFEVVVVAGAGQDLPSMPVTLVHDEVAFQARSASVTGCAGERGRLFVTSCDSAFRARI
jgi:hypothetical protein